MIVLSYINTNDSNTVNRSAVDYDALFKACVGGSGSIWPTVHACKRCLL